MKVLQVSQFVETSKLDETPFEGQEESSYCSYKDVDESEHPTVGHIWLTPNEEGMCQIWKYNYDTSD